MKIKFIALFLFVFVGLISLISAHVGDSGDYSGMGGMMSGAYGFGYMWIFGWIFMLLLVVALVLLIIWMIKQIQKK